MTAFLPSLALLLCSLIYARILANRGTLEVSRRSIVLLVLEFLLPLLIIEVFSKLSFKEDLPVLGVTWIFSAAIMILSGGLTHWVYTWVFPTPLKTRVPLIFGTAFCNATYLGVPLVKSFIGEHTTYVAFAYDLTLMTPVLLTAGVWLCNRASPQQKGKAALSILRPPLLAFAFSVFALLPLLNWTNFQIPSALLTFLKIASSAVAPLMLIAVGLLLELKIKPGKTPLWPALLIRLGVAPLFTFLAFKLGGHFFPQTLELLPIDVRRTLLLESALPSMILPILLTESFELDRQTHAKLITLSTLLSLLTVPFWMSLSI